MSEPQTTIAFYDGEILPADRVAIPYWDLGFAQGVSATEQIRSYGGRMPLLDIHLSRLCRGLQRLEISLAVSLADIRKNIQLIVEHNYRMIPAGSDLGVCAVVSAGSVQAFVPESVPSQRAARPKVLVHSFPLPWEQWRTEFRQGVRLARSEIREVPAASHPRDFKHRSRLHYYLAQRDVERRQPGCRPLLSTIDGKMADSTTAGILMYHSGSWVSPASSQVLHSVTVEVVEQLARVAGIPFARRPIEFSELTRADEVMYCSTPTALLPVVELDGEPIGGGRPGPHFEKMAELWSARVGLDYRLQGRGEFSRPLTL